MVFATLGHTPATHPTAMSLMDTNLPHPVGQSVPDLVPHQARWSRHGMGALATSVLLSSLRLSRHPHGGRGPEHPNLRREPMARDERMW
jgi:hypothetical protein